VDDEKTPPNATKGEAPHSAVTGDPVAEAALSRPLEPLPEHVDWAYAIGRARTLADTSKPTYPASSRADHPAWAFPQSCNRRFGSQWRRLALLLIFCAKLVSLAQRGRPLAALTAVDLGCSGVSLAAAPV